MTENASCFFEGTVRHRRWWPTQHSFQYPLFMVYLDIDHIDDTLSHRWLFSTRPWSLVRFKRKDYLGSPDESIRDAVEHKLHRELGIASPNIGKIMLLTNLRFFGFLINPISCYYCFNKQGELTAMIAEVTNTPWGEQQVYVLKCNPSHKYQRLEFNKAMHVSPFNPMQLIYDWRNNTPEEHLALHMNCVEKQPQHAPKVHTDATLNLSRKPFSRKHALTLWMRYPMMTVRIALGIYWQALRLLLKRTPLYPHPNKHKHRITDKPTS